MTANHSFYGELARLEGERDAARVKLAEALATLTDVLSYFPKSVDLRSITPDHAVHVCRVMLDHHPTVQSVCDWHKTLEALFT